MIGKSIRYKIIPSQDGSSNGCTVSESEIPGFTLQTEIFDAETLFGPLLSDEEVSRIGISSAPGTGALGRAFKTVWRWRMNTIIRRDRDPSFTRVLALWLGTFDFSVEPRDCLNWVNEVPEDAAA